MKASVRDTTWTCFTSCISKCFFSFLRQTFKKGNRHWRDCVFTSIVYKTCIHNFPQRSLDCVEPIFMFYGKKKNQSFRSETVLFCLLIWKVWFHKKVNELWNFLIPPLSHKSFMLSHHTGWRLNTQRPHINQPPNRHFHSTLKYRKGQGNISTTDMQLCIKPRPVIEAQQLPRSIKVEDAHIRRIKKNWHLDVLLVEKEPLTIWTFGIFP